MANGDPNYLIFRNVDTRNLAGGVAIAKMPSHKKAAMRYTEFYVRGRDGALRVNEGFSDMDIKTTLVLLDASVASRQAVNAWADGYGKLISSDNLNIAYLASVNQEVVWKRQKGNGGFFDTAEITFTCKPYMVEVEEVEYYATQGTSILLVNPGSSEAYPLIRIRGQGNSTFTVGDYTVTVKNVASNEDVFLDCETGYIYSENGRTKTMVGDFPVLGYGSTNVYCGSNTSQVKITPRWRWV